MTLGRREWSVGVQNSIDVNLWRVLRDGKFPKIKAMFGCMSICHAGDVVEVGGVRTLFRMPDLLSIAIGGGTKVSADAQVVGPESVGYKLGSEALVFGGRTLTCTDIAVASGRAKIGNPELVAHLENDVTKRAFATIHERLSDAVDRVKTDASPVPLLTVGGGAMLIPEKMDGISEVVHVKHEAVANAVGAAIAQISGETDRLYRDVPREDAISQATTSTIDQAILAGAAKASIKVIESEDLPLSYLPGQALRVRVRVVGDANG